MREYLGGIVATVVVCQAVTLFSRGGESTRRYIGLICTLVVLLTLATPVISLCSYADGAIEWFYNLFRGETVESETSCEDEGLEQLAYFVMRTVEMEYGIDSDKIRLTLVTDEFGDVTEIQLYLSRIAYSDRERVRDGLEGEFDFPVYVFGEG